MASATNKNIVVEWLKSLHLGQYAESFIDNGYDDLEICKQIGDPDLDAIGVLNANHRSRLLGSIKTLREEGAASVYFTLEESQIIQENCKLDSDSKSSSEKLESPGGSAWSRRSNSATSLAGDFVDDYEEGKAQLVRIPKLQLKMLIRDKLHQDNIKLSAQPYSTQDGERGYLEGLASRYADLFNTHYRDVLVHLEDLRRREWAELSPRIKILGGDQTPTTPPGPAPNSPSRAFPNSHLPTSQSQPIYVPGKYSPSSCLSDREEDEIYGFSGYGVYGKQMVQRQQQQAKLVVSNSNNYHSCLSPRSAYFYEFPPNERASKKKTTFSRFLKTLKSSKHKDKSSSGGSTGVNNNSSNQANHNSPKHSTVNSRINTPDCLREPQTIYPPLDCERLRGPGRHSNFEETINRLKLQDALEKKQRFDREHEEILRDIRTGLLHLNRTGVSGPPSGDDTYMYDDEMLRHYGPHWYDEPPYESDPEDFLMVGQEQPNGRVCYTLSNRPESAQHHRVGRGHGPPPLNPGAEGAGGSVISLRSAGDISLPQNSRHSVHQRGLLLPHTGLIIPLRGSNKNRESGDYAMSDVQSICSRLSSVSMETSRSDQIDPELYHRLRCCNGGDRVASPGHSSDYADEDLITLNSSCSASTPLAPRNRIGGGGGRPEEKYNRRHGGRYYHSRKQHSGRAPRSNSSAESLPSTCSTQVLLEDRKSAVNGSNSSVVMTRAVALVDNNNSPYDKEALKFKKGDIINVISMCTSGLWRGYLAHDEQKRVGTFKFINVQLVPLDTSVKPFPPRSKYATHRSRDVANLIAPPTSTHKHRPKTLEQLLRTIDMEEHMSVFVLNGYEDLESFCEIKEEDLNYLKILNPEHRAKILAAVQVMHEYESPEEDDESSLDGDDSSYSGQQLRNNLDSELSADDTRSTNTTSTTIVSNNSSGGKTGELDVSDTVVTCGDKVQVIKYIPGDVECESGNPTSTPSQRNGSISNTYCGFSEKSSDSGVSSSSVSSAHNVKQPLPVRRSNGLPLGVTSSPSHPVAGGSKVALIERSNRSYVGHFIRKPAQQSVPLND